MTTEESIKKLDNSLLFMNIALFFTIATMGFLAVMVKSSMSRLTEKTAEIAQKVDVDFQTETNNVLWIRSVKLKKQN